MNIENLASKQWDVVVVGGGMVGATTALDFAQNGFSVLLLEKQQPVLEWSESRPYQARVSALTRASENIFKSLGVWQGIEKRRLHAFTDMHVWEDISEAEVHFSAAEISEKNLGFVVENEVIVASLWEKILEYKNIQPIFSEKIIQIDLKQNNANLTFESGLTLTTKLLVAADGAFSSTRDLVGIKTIEHDYQQCAIVGCVKTELSNQNTCWQRYQNTGPFAYLSMEKNVSSIAWYLPVEKMQWALDLSETAFKEELEKASGLKLGKVEDVYQKSGFPLVRRHAEAYVKPHFALVGDAAHTVHPQAGQGVNLGLLDAVALVQVVSEERQNTDKDWGRKSVLRRYERWRKGDNVIVQRAMEGFDWLFKQDNASKNSLRSSFISFGNNLKLVKNWLMIQVLNGRGTLPNKAN